MDEDDPPADCGDRELGKTRLLAEPCTTCILRPAGQRLDLTNQGITEFVRTARQQGTFVVCHATLPAVAAPGVQPAVCRGFHDAYPDNPTLTMIRRLWGFVHVPVPPCPGDTRV